MSPPITVVQMIARFDLGGAQKVVASLLAGLDPAAFLSKLVCGPGGEWEDGIPPGVERLVLRGLDREIRPGDALRLGTLVNWLMRVKAEAPGPVIVHTHAPKALVLGGWGALLAGIPHRLHTVHGFSFDNDLPWPRRLLYRELERIGHLAHTAVASVSEANAKLGQRLGFFRRAEVIRPAVPLATFRDAAESHRERLPSAMGRVSSGSGVERETLTSLAGTPILPSALRIGMIAAFKRYKEHGDALRTLVALGEWSPLGATTASHAVTSVESAPALILVGDGPERPHMEMLARQLGVAHRVAMLGWRRDVAALLPTFEVLLLPSSQEGLPVVLIEALAAGVPVVASRVAGVPEIVREGETGYMIAPHDIQGFAAALRQALTSPTLKQTLQAAAPAILTEYDEAHTLRCYEGLYRRMTGV